MINESKEQELEQTKIDPEKMYYGAELRKIVNFKSRHLLVKAIKDKKLMAIQVGQNNATRYICKGSWVLEFRKKAKKPYAKIAPFTDDEIKTALQAALKNYNPYVVAPLSKDAVNYMHIPRINISD